MASDPKATIQVPARCANRHCIEVERRDDYELFCVRIGFFDFLGEYSSFRCAVSGCCYL